MEAQCLSSITRVLTIGRCFMGYACTVNTVMTTPLNLKVSERKAVIILTSQKTLPVAVTVISFLDGESYNLGIIVIPCILCHLCQLVIDGLFVNKWATMTEEGGLLNIGRVPTSKVELQDGADQEGAIMGP